MPGHDPDANPAAGHSPGPLAGQEQEHWTRRSLPGGWVLALRFVSQEDEVVIAELRLFPEVEGGRDPEGVLDLSDSGKREMSRTGGGPDIPEGGITSGLLRELPLSAERHEADRRFLSALQSGEVDRDEVELPSLDAIRSCFWDLDEQPDLPRRGRARPDEYYALIAAVYELALKEEPRRPLRFVERQLEIPIARIRDALHRARVLGLLSQGSPGRAGGVLTEEGQRVLSNAVNERGDVDLQHRPTERPKKPKKNKKKAKKKGQKKNR